MEERSSMRGRRSERTGFFDLLLQLTLLFAACFFISLVNMAEAIKKEGIKQRAEFIIILTWPDDNHSDVDLWVQDPTDEVMYFNRKEVNLMHLDRDDLGWKKDMISLPDGQRIEVKSNQEVAAIRGFMAGEWTVNVHLYKKSDEGDIPVRVQVSKMNPNIKQVLQKDLVLKESGEELTVTRLLMSGAGDVMGLDDTPKSIVAKHLVSTMSSTTTSRFGGGVP